MDEEKKETVGAAAKRLQEEKAKETGEVSALEASQYHLAKSNYIEELESTVLSNRDKPYFEGEDFFVEVITRLEKALPDVIRNQFVAKKKCPSPAAASAVFQYHHSSEEIEFLWQIPRIEKCHELFNNRHQVHPEEYELLGFVVEFFNGDLLKKAKILSGETDHTIQGSIKIVEH